ncbi:MAG: hypothetical protein PHO11_02315 [Bacteroidales bacterium]|nr:hypothetical protein [Bacteroidales bacterium]
MKKHQKNETTGSAFGAAHGVPPSRCIGTPTAHYSPLTKVRGS